jgi:menaquinone-dependent protoporphyrinogen IX oxidase
MMAQVFTPILIAFPGTGHADGCVAAEIAATLRDEALDVHVHELEALPSLDRYGAVVVGGSLDTGTWQATARQFLTQNRSRLVLLPVAVFALTDQGSVSVDPRERHELLQELARYRWLHPISAEVFRAKAGRVTKCGCGKGGRAAVDPDEVRTWARLVARLLTPLAARS